MPSTSSPDITAAAPADLAEICPEPVPGIWLAAAEISRLTAFFNTRGSVIDNPGLLTFFGQDIFEPGYATLDDPPGASPQNQGMSGIVQDSDSTPHAGEDENESPDDPALHIDVLPVPGLPPAPGPVPPPGSVPLPVPVPIVGPLPGPLHGLPIDPVPPPIEPDSGAGQVGGSDVAGGSGGSAAEHHGESTEGSPPSVETDNVPKAGGGSNHGAGGSSSGSGISFGISGGGSGFSGAGGGLNLGGAVIVGSTAATLEHIVGSGNPDQGNPDQDDDDQDDVDPPSDDEMPEPPPSGNTGGDPVPPPAPNGPAFGPVLAPGEPPNIFLLDQEIHGPVPGEPPNVFLLPPEAFIDNEPGVIDEDNETLNESDDDVPMPAAPVAPGMTAMLAWIHAVLDQAGLPLDGYQEDDGATDDEVNDDAPHSDNGSDMDIDSAGGGGNAAGHAAVNLAVNLPAPNAAPSQNTNADLATPAAHEQASPNAPGNRAAPLLLQLALGPEHSGNAAHSMDIADVSSNISTIRIILDQWMGRLPLSTGIELQGFDVIASPDGDAPMSLMVQLSVHATGTGSAAAALASQYVPVLESMILAQLAAWMSSPERAEQHADEAAADGTVDLLIIGSLEAASLH